MKKILFVLGLLSLMPVAAGAENLEVGGADIEGDATLAKEITAVAGTTVPFSSFTMTLSKGVGIIATETAAEDPSPSITVTTGHFNSTREYAGNTNGGSVVECTSATGKKTAGAGEVIAATYSAGAC